MKPVQKIRRWLSPARLWRQRHSLNIENKGLMLMSFLLAVALFVISRQPLSDVTLFNVPLEYRGQHPGVEISGDVAEMVSVRVHGPRDIVRSLLPTQLSVIADLSNKEAGERVIQLHPMDVSLPDSSIQVVQIEPASIKLKLEPKAKKRVSVEVQFIGRLADGLELYGSKAEPDSIEIEGAESLVNKVTRLLTETVNLNGRNKNFQATADVETPHTSLRVLTATPIKLSVEIGEHRIFKRFAAIPVQSPNSTTLGRLLTKNVEIELYGPNSVLDVLQAKDLRVEIPADSATTALPKVILPASVSPQIEVRKIIPNEVKLKK